GRIGELAIQRLVLWPIQTTMECGDDGCGRLPCQDKAELVQVAVHNVEVVQFTPRLAECDRQQRCEVAIPILTAPECLLARWHQARRSLRIACREERDVVTTANELFGQGVYNALGATVTDGGNRLKRWC